MTGHLKTEYYPYITVLFLIVDLELTRNEDYNQPVSSSAFGSDEPFKDFSSSKNNVIFKGLDFVILFSVEPKKVWKKSN